MARFLKFISLIMLIGWFLVFVTVASGQGPRLADASWVSWLASAALLNNFTAAIFIGVPVLITLAPVMLLSEWLWKKGEDWGAHSERNEAHPVPCEAVGPVSTHAISAEEMEALRRKTEAGTQRTENYLHAYFGPNGPSRPKPKSRRR